MKKLLERMSGCKILGALGFGCGLVDFTFKEFSLDSKTKTLIYTRNENSIKHFHADKDNNISMEQVVKALLRNYIVLDESHKTAKLFEDCLPKKNIELKRILDVKIEDSTIKLYTDTNIGGAKIIPLNITLTSSSFVEKLNAENRKEFINSFNDYTLGLLDEMKDYKLETDFTSILEEVRKNNEFVEEVTSEPEVVEEVTSEPEVDEIKEIVEEVNEVNISAEEALIPTPVEELEIKKVPTSFIAFDKYIDIHHDEKCFSIDTSDGDENNGECKVFKFNKKKKLLVFGVCNFLLKDIYLDKNEVNLWLDSHGTEFVNPLPEDKVRYKIYGIDSMNSKHQKYMVLNIKVGSETEECGIIHLEFPKNNEYTIEYFELLETEFKTCEQIHDFTKFFEKLLDEKFSIIQK